MIKRSEELHDKLAVALGQTCQQHLSDAFKKFFQLAASQLPAMAMTAKSNRLQTLFYDAQRVRWPRFSRQLIPIYKWIHAPSVMLPIMLAAIQNILDPVSARRGWNAVDDCCRT